MLHSKISPNRVIINGITYIKVSDSILRPEELLSDFSPSLFKVIILGSIVPLFFIYTIAHLIL
jgi:hypothetical protein